MMVKSYIRVATAAALLVFPRALLAAPALVADVESGKVIYANQATDPWYPASVTKLMTTYVVFSAIESGKITLDTPLTVSARALSQPPSKMGVKVGLVVTVDNALKMIMVKSANDMAVVLAEGVGGSVEGFAEMMNAAAQRLGMHESHFVNPHGLPDDRNQTSARDLAILARALLTQFPKYQGYFSIDAIRLGRAVMKNHNGLIGRYPGADGMKTGFICAGGFNVVATATRGNKRLIVVVLGSRNATERTIKAATLFDKGFSDVWGGYMTLEALPSAQMQTPVSVRDQVCGGNRNRGEDDEEMPTPVSAGLAPEGLLLGFFGKPTPAAGSIVAANGHSLIPRSAYVPIPVFVGASAETAVADPIVIGRHRGKKHKAHAVAGRKASGKTAKAAKAVTEKAESSKAKASPKSEAGKTAAKPKAKSASLNVKPKAQGGAATTSQ